MIEPVTNFTTTVGPATVTFARRGDDVRFMRSRRSGNRNGSTTSTGWLARAASCAGTAPTARRHRRAVVGRGTAADPLTPYGWSFEGRFSHTLLDLRIAVTLPSRRARFEDFYQRGGRVADVGACFCPGVGPGGVFGGAAWPRGERVG